MTVKTTISQPMPTIYISADFGNHFTKMSLTRPGFPTESVIVNSALMFDQPEKAIKYEPDDSDVFFCKHGCKTWRDKSWFPHPKGLRPFNLNGTAFCKGDSAKGMLAFPLLVSTAWDYLKDGDVIALNASTQNIHTTRDLMIAELEGVHTITCNKESKRITILKPDVLAEGVGVLLYAGSKKTDVTTLLDIGGDTVIVSIFAGLKLKGDVIATPGLGTNFFLHEAQGSPELSTLLNRQPYNQEETLKIIRNEIQFPDKDGMPLNFEPAIRKLAEKWLHEIFNLTIDPYKLRVNESNVRVATGGAIHISGIAECLNVKGFTTVEDGQNANVKGLHTRLLGQNGVTSVEPKKAKKVKSTVKKVEISVNV